MTNEYSRRWFGSFLDTIPGEWTARDVAGITRRIPLPTFRRVLDICCGSGRHAGPLSDAGYQITGVDRDAHAIAQAERRVPAAKFVVLDQRDLGALGDTFDAAVILWQSFGYFDPPTNDQVLAEIAGLLHPGGRLLLDLYHPGFARANIGNQRAARAPDCRSVTSVVDGGRLFSTITYVDGANETMDFELFEPTDLARRAEHYGFRTIEACSWWDSESPPSPNEQRYQLVLERTVR